MRVLKSSINIPLYILLNRNRIDEYTIKNKEFKCYVLVSDAFLKRFPKSHMIPNTIYYTLLTL